MRRYAITPGVLEHGTGLAGVEQLLSRAAALAADGVELLLLREKALGVGEMADLTQRVVAATAGSGMRIVVPAGLREAVGVGVHCSPASFDLLKEHSPELWVSVSCHTLEEISQVAEAGADAILFAPVFGKDSRRSGGRPRRGTRTPVRRLRASRPCARLRSRRSHPGECRSVPRCRRCWNRRDPDVFRRLRVEETVNKRIRLSP